MEADLGEHSRPTTARTRELGWELLLARKRANLTGTKVAEELGWSAGKLSKLERGWRSTSDWDYGTLLGKLGADPQTRERIHRIASEQDTGYFIRTFEGRLPDSLLCLSIHEGAAVTIADYESIVVPGMLQTEQYAKVMINPDGELSAEEENLLVGARLARQAVLSGRNSPEAVYYIHEAALHTMVSDNQVMHDQMLRLAFMCDWTRLTPRVIPLGTRGHAALHSPFKLMTFPKHTAPIAYTEAPTATTFVEEPQAIDVYRSLEARLASVALDGPQSKAVFMRWADEYDRRLQERGIEVA